MSTPIFFTKLANLFSRAGKWFFEIFVPEENNQYLPGILKPQSLFWYSLFLLAVKIAAISFLLLLPYSGFFSAITQDRLVSLINQARQNNNLPAVSLNSVLNETAGLKANDMLANDYFEHTSPSGITPWFWFKKTGYNYAYAGENLAIDFAETNDVFSAWMASPAHRANILNPNFNEIGLAVKTGPLKNHDATLAVLIFGKQQSVKINQPSTVKTQPETPKTTPKAQVSIKPSATPAAPKASTPATPATTPSGQPSVSPSNSASPSATPSQIPIGEENIELKSVAGEVTENSKVNGESTQISLNPSSLAVNKWTPKVLGAFASKTDEITKSLYLYFTLFLALALIVNIFVKIEIQYWQTIFSTTLVILLSGALIFI